MTDDTGRARHFGVKGEKTRLPSLSDIKTFTGTHYLLHLL